MQFKVVKTYRVNNTLGFVYILNGKRCASFAKDIDSLRKSLGISAKIHELITLTRERKRLRLSMGKAREIWRLLTAFNYTSHTKGAITIVEFYGCELCVNANKSVAVLRIKPTRKARPRRPYLPPHLIGARLSPSNINLPKGRSYRSC